MLSFGVAAASQAGRQIVVHDRRPLPALLADTVKNNWPFAAQIETFVETLGLQPAGGVGKIHENHWFGNAGQVNNKR